MKPFLCDWKRCNEKAKWTAPTLDENWHFKQGMACDKHRRVVDKMLKQLGVRTPDWQRTDDWKPTDETERQRYVARKLQAITTNKTP
jgi:hypothetical protein